MGRVHLLSPNTPRMVVYALDPATNLWASTETAAADGEAPFSLQVAPGSYEVFAFSADTPASAGHEAATGWGLAQVTVAAGQTVADIVVRPPSQSECGSMFGLPAAPDGRFAAIPGPEAKCMARYARPPLATNATRVQFAAGATSAQLTGAVTVGKINSYVLRINAQQSLKLKLTATLNNQPVPGAALAMLLRGADGMMIFDAWDTAPLVPDSAAVPTTFDSPLPATQDYYIDVALPAADATATVNYTLDLSVPAASNTAAALPHTVPPEFAAAVQTLAGTGVPLVLPPQFPVAAGLPAIYPDITIAEAGQFEMSLDYGPDCHGAGACRYGGLAGKKTNADKPTGTPNNPFNANSAEAVSLTRGLWGYVTLSACGASCSDTQVFWLMNGCEYVLGIKGAGRATELVALANAAIENSVTSAP